MSSNEKTQNKRSKVRRSQRSQDNSPTQKKQSRGLGGKGEIFGNNSAGLDRSDWRGRDPFGFTGGEIINELIESIRADINESQEIIDRHSRKIELLSARLENLKSFRSIQGKEIETTEQNNLIHEEE